MQWPTFSSLSMLFAIAENPYGNREWCDADKPFQAYAACREYRDAVLSGDPTSFISRIPIALDGSCSGIQNLSLAFRDEVGGSAVNIVPTECPSDIYQLVCDKSVAQLERLAGENAHGAEIPQDEAKVSDAELAQWWLDFGMSRKVTKRNCMTFPYGSKQRGFKLLTRVLHELHVLAVLYGSLKLA